MDVIVAASAGFCWGVERAVTKARELLAEGKGAVRTDGPLIHNERMMAQLRREGVDVAADPEAHRDGVLVVRAHGIPPGRRERLRKLRVTLADATCPDVARIQRTVEKYASQDFHVLIFGDTGHAEVVGLEGYARGRGHVISGPGDVRRLPELKNVCLVAQSTQFPPAFEKVAAAVRGRFPGAVVIDTICRATRARQEEMVQMARKVDAIVVVGGPHSANTLRLVQLARSHKPTFHVQSAAQIDRSAIGRYERVGLTAGASTPGFVIEEVRQALETIGPDGEADAGARRGVSPCE